MKKELRIAFTGGGSGGHVYPLLAVAQETKKIMEAGQINGKLFYLGAPGMYAQEFIATGLKIVPVISSKLRRYVSLSNVIDAVKFPFALAQAFWKVFWIMPDALFCKGGTGSLPISLAAWFYRVPIFVHESDSVPGLSNSIIFSLATRAGVAFNKVLEEWEGEKTALVGNPARPFLIESSSDLTPGTAKHLFGFDPNLPLILVLGGSQGAQRLNDFMLDNVQEFVGKYQVLHQTGIDNFEQFKRELAVATEHFIPEQRACYKAINFFKQDIKEALMAADVIVSRAGSGAIAEIALFGKPSILIPLKGSARNHQFFNALEYSRTGAAIVIEEDNLSPAIFFAQISKVVSDAAVRQRMSASALTFAKPHAARVIAQELVRIAHS